MIRFLLRPLQNWRFWVRKADCSSPRWIDKKRAHAPSESLPLTCGAKEDSIFSLRVLRNVRLSRQPLEPLGCLEWKAFAA